MANASASAALPNGICPVCLKTHRITSPQGSLMRCPCGVSLIVSQRNRLVVAIESTAPETTVPAASVSKGSAIVITDDSAQPRKKQAETAKAVTPPHAKKKSWLVVGGAGSVVAMLLVSVLMFAFRSSGEEERLAEIARRNQLPPPPVAEKRELAPGQLRRLAAQIPIPSIATSSSDSSSASTTLVSTDDSASGKSTRSAKAQRSPYGGPTVAPELTLPPIVKPRPFLPITPAADSSRVFAEAYGDAFQSYEAWNAMGEDKSSTPDYQKQLSETLGYVKVAYAQSLRQAEVARQNELRYLLTFLSFKAGRLMDAAIYGEAIARWGDPKENATRDAAFIALAATQEASSNHWGDPRQVGELRQMQTIAELIDAKWPNEPQRDAVWMALGQLYGTFGHPSLAMSAYRKIVQPSPLAGEAKLGVGFALWSQFLTRASEPDPDAADMVKLLKQASQELGVGVKTIEAAAGEPTRLLVSAKQTLAVIAERTDDTEAVKRSLTEGKFPLILSIRVADSTGDAKPAKAKSKTSPKTIDVPASFAKSVFDLLYRLGIASNDLTLTQQALAGLKDVVGQTGADGLQSLEFVTVVRQIKDLAAQRGVSSNDLDSLDATIQKMKPGSTAASPQDWLWIAQSWASLAEKSGGVEDANRCYRRAAATVDAVVESGSLPESAAGATRALQAEWLRAAGETSAALAAITAVLDQTPNVFDLQMQAALALEQLSIERNSEPLLRRAIADVGDTEKLNEELTLGAVWGWSKLAVNLHQVRYSDRGTDRHAEALVVAHFHLARCRWLLINVLESGVQRDTLQQQFVKQLATARLAIPESSAVGDAWRTAFDRLQAALSSS